MAIIHVENFDYRYRLVAAFTLCKIALHHRQQGAFGRKRGIGKAHRPVGEQIAWFGSGLLQHQPGRIAAKRSFAVIRFGHWGQQRVIRRDCLVADSLIITLERAQRGVDGFKTDTPCR